MTSVGIAPHPTPLGREGHADEVAPGVAFLLSDAAGFSNGIAFLANGGVRAAFRTPPIYR